jgi:hypothetical protein
MEALSVLKIKGSSRSCDVNKIIRLHKSSVGCDLSELLTDDEGDEVNKLCKEDSAGKIMVKPTKDSTAWMILRVGVFDASNVLINRLVPKKKSNVVGSILTASLLTTTECNGAPELRKAVNLISKQWLLNQRVLSHWRCQMGHFRYVIKTVLNIQRVESSGAFLDTLFKKGVFSIHPDMAAYTDWFLYTMCPTIKMDSQYYGHYQRRVFEVPTVVRPDQTTLFLVCFPLFLLRRWTEYSKISYGCLVVQIDLTRE